MSFERTQRAAAAALLCLALAACGGGGGGGDDQPAALPTTLSVEVPASVDPGQALTLGTNATDAVGLRYAWDFGDGTTSAEAAPSHTWAAPGRYTLTVTLTNNAGETRSVTTTVTVGQLANVAGLLCTEANDAGWCWQRPLPTGNPVNALAMLDAGTGWAVGERGTLLKTVDGGASWTGVPGPSTAALSDVAFADAQHGWALASDGSIWQTTNGGTRWTAVLLDIDKGDGMAVNGGSLRVISASRALAGNAASMVATEDGGLTWRRTALVADVVTPNGTLYATTGGAGGELLRSTDFGKTASVVASGAAGLYATYGSAASFSDDRNGWFLVSGYDYSFNWASRLLRTTDGGETWVETTASGLPGVFSNVQIRMYGDAGWIWSPVGQLYRTTDGGAQWSPVTQPPLWWMQTAKAIDATTLFVAGYGGAWLTTDGGASWKSVTPEDEEAMGSATTPRFQRAGSVWLIQYGPRVYRSNDQGASWQRVLGAAPDEANTALRSLWFIDAKNGFAASDGGVLLRTTDGGRQWTPSEVTVAGRTSSGALQFVDTKTGWLLLGSDTIARTTDGGTTWLVTATGTPPGGVTTFQFLDANRGWALGRTATGSANGALWQTTDGGVNWQATTLPSTEFNALAFADANTGLLVGNGGRVSRSTDGGKTWTAVASGVVQAFYGVRFTSATEAWIVGSSGTLLHSTDAGASWTAAPGVQTFTHFRDIRFAGTKNGWVVGDAGTILATRDGGLTWSAQASGTARDLFSVFALDAGTAWIGGADGLVLATAFGGGR